MLKNNKILSNITNEDIFLLDYSPNDFWEDILAIEKDAFINIDSLKKIDIPDFVLFLGDGCFSYCKKLKDVVLGKDITKIPSFCFFGCSSLEKITMLKNITSIGEKAFWGCNLKEINIPDSVNFIDNHCFCNCYNLESIILPKNLKSIQPNTFSYCESLKYVFLPNKLELICNNAFKNCLSLKQIVIPNSVKELENFIFDGCDNLEQIEIPITCKFSYTSFMHCSLIKNGYVYFVDNKIIISKQKDSFLENNSLYKISSSVLPQLAGNSFNFYQNLQICNKLFKLKKINFMPSIITLKQFPYTQMSNFFVNKNYKRWGQLVKALEIEKMDKQIINTTLTNLLKIYYAIGGFSKNQGESEKAYKYVSNYIIQKNNPYFLPQYAINDIITNFLDLTLDGEYSPEFATFFMKNYHKNPDFLNLQLTDQNGVLLEKTNYLCPVHNAFKSILNNYPNMSVNGNNKRTKFTPEFLASKSLKINYTNIKKGNENLAKIISTYNYSQKQFDLIQEVFEKAKLLKNNFVIKADKALQNETVSFRVLEKDDPLGFVIGDITNCCQVIGSKAESCVIDGYTNENSGFIVFEQTILDNEGNPTDKKRLLGQSFVWYDPITKTVCFDNIEIPQKIINDLSKSYSQINIYDLLNAIDNCATSLIKTMNKNNIPVKRVTIGSKNNDIFQQLQIYYNEEINPIAKNRSNDCDYTDADEMQFILKSETDTPEEITFKNQTNKINNEDLENFVSTK